CAGPERAAWPSRTRPYECVCRCIRRGGHGVFLVEEHSGNSRVQPKITTDHADHYRDGCNPDRLVSVYTVTNRVPPAALSCSSKHEVGWQLFRVALRFMVFSVNFCCPAGGLWPLRAGDERRRISGPGESGN